MAKISLSMPRQSADRRVPCESEFYSGYFPPLSCQCLSRRYPGTILANASTHEMGPVLINIAENKGTMVDSFHSKIIRSIILRC